MTVAYNVYGSGVGVNGVSYTSPIAVVSDNTTWTSGSLEGGGSHWFGVRAFDVSTNSEEQNIDCALEIVLDANGNDITNRPFPPLALRAFPIAGGRIRIEWFGSGVCRAREPLGFNIYVGLNGAPNFDQPAVSVPASTMVSNRFYAILEGLSDGGTYGICVRAYNANAEEANTVVITVKSKSTGPMAVVSLTATAVV